MIQALKKNAFIINLFFLSLIYIYICIQKSKLHDFDFVMRQLIKCGTDPNCIGYEGYTFLHLVSKSSQYDAFEMLDNLDTDRSRVNIFAFGLLDFAKLYDCDDIIQLLSMHRSKLVLNMNSREDAPKVLDLTEKHKV